MSVYICIICKIVIVICLIKGIGSFVLLIVYFVLMVKFVDDVVDVIIVGDFVGMVLYGMFDMLCVMFDMMIVYGVVVVCGVVQVCVVVDLLFFMFQELFVQVYCFVVWLFVEIGVQVVKFEGGCEMIDMICFLIDCGILVMVYVGFMLQQVNVMGGFCVQGMDLCLVVQVFDVVCVVEWVGVFGVVIEGIVEVFVCYLIEMLMILMIGIGVLFVCDGQVFVIEDMIGVFDVYMLCFVKCYVDVNVVMCDVICQYVYDVWQCVFFEFVYCFGYGKLL